MTILLSATIGKCAKSVLFRIKEGELIFDLHPTVDVVSLIQGVGLRLTNSKTVIFEIGIAKNFENFKTAISEEILKTRAEWQLTIPLPKSVSERVSKNTNLYLYLTDSGRECAGSFTIVPQ